MRRWPAAAFLPACLPAACLPLLCSPNAWPWWPTWPAIGSPVNFCISLSPSCRSPVPKQVANFPVGIWSGSFLILSAIDHLLVVLPRVRWAAGQFRACSAGGQLLLCLEH